VQFNRSACQIRDSAVWFSSTLAARARINQWQGPNLAGAVSSVITMTRSDDLAGDLVGLTGAGNVEAVEHLDGEAFLAMYPTAAADTIRLVVAQHHASY